MSSGAFCVASRAGGADDLRVVRDAERVGRARRRLSETRRDAVDRADQSPDPVRRRDLQPDRLGGHEGPVGQEVVGDPARAAARSSAAAPAGRRRLELVEREAVERVHDGGHADPPGRDPAERPGLRAVGVDEVELARAQVLGELPQRLDVGPRIDCAARRPCGAARITFSPPSSARSKSGPSPGARIVRRVLRRGRPPSASRSMIPPEPAMKFALTCATRSGRTGANDTSTSPTASTMRVTEGPSTGGTCLPTLLGTMTSRQSTVGPSRFFRSVAAEDVTRRCGAGRRRSWR